MGLSVKPKFTLRKLPMWGKQLAANEINFEWPTQELLDQMPADASLRSLDLSYSHQKSGQGALSAIKCTLSNEQQSPLFLSKNSARYHDKVINFKGKRKVAKVQACDGNN